MKFILMHSFGIIYTFKAKYILRIFFHRKHDNVRCLKFKEYQNSRHFQDDFFVFAVILNSWFIG